MRKVEEFDTLTIWQVITATAGKTASDDLIGHVATQPLSNFKTSAQISIFELIAALMPPAKEPDENPKPSTKETPWEEAFLEMFKVATGWLGWSPMDAWNATPQEITDAFEGHIAKLKAIHGSDGGEPSGNQNEQQRQDNIANGLDPEFDRAGLQALKAKSRIKTGEAV